MVSCYVENKAKVKRAKWEYAKQKIEECHKNLCTGNTFNII